MLWSILRGGFPSLSELGLLLLGYLILLGVMMPAHEAAHAWAAVRLGDQTPRFAGRLTLNPLAHIDPIGALMIVLCGIGYAKPVPVNPRNFKNERSGMALVALAGPAANLLMAAVSIGLFRLILLFTGGMRIEADGVYLTNFSWAAYMVLIAVLARVNIALAVFNLLPLPPLDGSRIFGALLPARWTYWMDRYHTYVRLAVLLLVFTGVLDRPLAFMEGLIGNGLCWLFRLPGLF